MTGPRVLVAYASKNGSTAQIAQWIGESLAGQDIQADVRPAAEVGDLGGYDAVILGSGLYAGRWLRDAIRFTRRHRKALLEMPVWLFSSGPLDASAAERTVSPVRTATRAAERVDAADHMTFGGRLTDGAHGFVARQILAKNKGGDFRDREQIRTWALKVGDDVAAGRHELI